MRFREVLKENKLIHKLGIGINIVYYGHVKKQTDMIRGMIYRVKTPYINLKSLKGKYDGERCFIVCTGPSLTLSDLELIKNEYSFGMNSIIKIFNQTEWRPTFYGIQDIYVYKKMKDEIESANLSTVFVGSNIKRKYNVPKGSIIFPLSLYGHQYSLKHSGFRFSNNASAIVYDGYSITYSLLQIAYFLGFEEVYLLGCDCNYSMPPDKQHFVSSGHVDKNAYLMGDLQRKAYEKVQEFSDYHKFSVFNTTRGGCLEVFTRKILEDVLHEDKKGYC